MLHLHRKLKNQVTQLILLPEKKIVATIFLLPRSVFVKHISCFLAKKGQSYAFSNLFRSYICKYCFNQLFQICKAIIVLTHFFPIKIKPFLFIGTRLFKLSPKAKSCGSKFKVNNIILMQNFSGRVHTFQQISNRAIFDHGIDEI